MSHPKTKVTEKMSSSRINRYEANLSFDTELWREAEYNDVVLGLIFQKSTIIMENCRRVLGYDGTVVWGAE